MGILERLQNWIIDFLKGLENGLEIAIDAFREEEGKERHNHYAQDCRFCFPVRPEKANRKSRGSACLV